MRLRMLLCCLVGMLVLSGCGAQVAAEPPTPAVTPLPPTVAPTARPAATPTPPSGGAWSVRTGESSFDDSPTVILSLVANEPITGWLETATPILLLRCQERQVEAYIVTDMAAEIVTGLLDQARARIRIDQEPAEDIFMNRSSDDKALFFRDPEGFIRQIEDSERLLFGFTPFNASPVETTFTTDGLVDVLPQLLEQCPAPTPIPEPSPTATIPAGSVQSIDPYVTLPKQGTRLAAEPGGAQEGSRMCQTTQIRVFERQAVDGVLWLHVEVVDGSCDLAPPLATIGETGWIMARDLRVAP